PLEGTYGVGHRGRQQTLTSGPIVLPRRSPMSPDPSPGSNHPPGSDHPRRSPPAAEPFETDASRSKGEVVSHKLSQLYVRAFGRGPNRARAFVQPQFTVCVLRDVLTTAERTL